MAKKYAPMKEYPRREDIPDEWWARLNMSEADYAAHRERRLQREEGAPKVGQMAPEFSAERLTSNGERTGSMLRLSELRGKPTALVFGSYT